MKKKIIVVLICMLCMFTGLKNVSAASTTFMEGTQNCVKDNGKNVCTFGLKFYKDYIFSYPNITMTFYLTSLSFDSESTITAKPGWEVVSTDYNNNQIVVKRIGGSFLANTEYPIVEIAFGIIGSGEGCNVVWSPYVTPNSYCHYNQTTNKYYGSNGAETTRANYLKECHGTPACQERTFDEIGTVYTDKSGNEVTKEQYEAVCGDNTCKIVDNKYYNKNGEETDKAGYVKDCKTPCEVLDDGTFVGSDNDIVDEATYNNQCKYHCEYVYGKYYDKDGNETTEINYKKTCEKNVCTKLEDGTYYNLNGEETDELTYQKECQKNTCKILSDGTYYDKDGNVTTKENYELTCKVHKCEVINDNYFNDKGNKVTKEEYDKVCTNPGTGINLPYFYIAGGILAAGLIFIYSKKHKKLNRI